MNYKTSFIEITETIKLLEENIGRTLHYINHNKILYEPTPRTMEIKQKLLHSKGNCKGEKTTLRMEENNSKLNN